MSRRHASRDFGIKDGVIAEIGQIAAPGYKHILVNGQITMRDDRPTNTYSVWLLRHGV